MCQNEILQKPGSGLRKQDGLLWRQDVFKGEKDVNGEKLLGGLKRKKKRKMIQSWSNILSLK